MRAPRAADYVIGNAGSVLAILGGSGWATYAWWTGQVAGDWIPIAAFCVSGVAVNANTRLTAYRAWKDSWDIMGGAAVPPPRLTITGCRAELRGSLGGRVRVVREHGSKQPCERATLICGRPSFPVASTGARLGQAGVLPYPSLPPLPSAARFGALAPTPDTTSCKLMGPLLLPGAPVG